MSTVCIFVYGTLKEGFPNFSLNSGRRVAGVFRTREAFPLYVVKLHNEDRAPWLMDMPGEGHRVVGQVFEVDASALRTMDTLEEVGLPTGYVRVQVALDPCTADRSADASGEPLLAHVYLKPSHQLADCLQIEGPYAEYTLQHAEGYYLDMEWPDDVDRPGQ